MKNYLINNAVLSEEQISISAHEAPPHASGIYYLFDRDEVVYVGMSLRNLRGRITLHMGNEREKPFTHVAWIVLPPDQVRAAEADAIWRYRPRFNIVLPGKKQGLTQEAHHG
jgi:excinuclease UvrABC nuclease subunit